MPEMNEHVIMMEQVFDVLAQKAPGVITNLMKTLFSAEAGTNMGKAVGNLYKELIEAGIPQDAALKMASDYMVSIKDVLKGMNPEGAGTK